MAERNIQAVYPLTPLQEGMLFHTIRGAASDVYLSQYACRLRGGLDERAFRQAWAGLVERHAVLRTLFTWERRERPLQVVRERVEVPFESVDWRGRSRSEQEDSWRQLLERDRQRGFDLGQAPLTRLTLVRLADEEWRFLWSVHHILLDGWSGRLVIQELLESCEALGAGRQPALAPVRPFADYVAWLRGRDLTPDREFWKDHLAGFAAPTPLPCRPPERPGRGSGLVEATLSTEASAALRQTARRLRITLNTLTLAAWAALLARHSGEQDVAFGVTVAVRPPEIEGVEETVGLLLNTVPLRVRVDDQSPLEEWVRALQSLQAAVREHEAAPLPEIQRWSEIPLGRSVFDTLVAFENFPETSPPAESSLALEDEKLIERSNYALALLVFPAERLGLTLVHDHAKCDADQAQALLSRLAAILEQLGRGSAPRVADLSAFTAPESRLVVEEWSGLRIAPPAPRDVLALFEESAAAAPDAPAVVAESVTLSYSELNRRANRLARRLQALGAGPGTIVPLLLERSPELIVAMLAALKAGAAYAPLDLRWPEGRLDQTLAALAAHAPVLIARSHSGGPISRVLDPERGAEALEREDAANFGVPVSETDAAYVIYTSGSTGAPKGVVVERRHLAASTAARLAYYPEPLRSFLLLSSPAVDSSVAGIYWALCSGGALVLPRERAEQDVAALGDLIEQRQVSHTLLLPSLYRLILENARAGLLGSLRCVAVAGEACPPELVQLHERTLPETTLYNEYGPAEGTVWATVAELRASGPVSIGRPIPGARIYLLDAQMRTVPPGAAGEIFLGGAGVARGYLDQPALTSERFLPDPFEPGGRLYRTGDRGRFLPDGQIDFLGRVDRQIKVRGYRVEPDEIERAMELHPGVREAAVVAWNEPSEREILAALSTLEPAEAEDLLSRIEALP